ncbi:MAG: GNAT family N-acetyltransferase [Thermoanaerobaculia bacterium]
MAVVIRPAGPRDRAAIHRLFRAAFGSDADPAEWEWKYDRNPNPAPSAVALDGDRALAFYGGCGTRYRGAGGDFPGASAVDVMTDPEARTLGHRSLFRDVGEGFCRLCGEAGIPFYFGFPHERARIIGERTLGYRSVERAGLWVKPLGPPSLLGRLRRHLLRSRTASGVSAGHEALAEVLHARPGWRTDRSRKTLDWRYAPRAGAAYRFVELQDRRAVSRGYAVVRLVLTRALLVDLQVRDEESGDVGDLLEAVSGSLDGSGATSLELRASSSSRLATRLESEFRFAREASDCHFEIRPIDPAFDALAAGRVFDYRFADHEIF